MKVKEPPPIIYYKYITYYDSSSLTGWVILSLLVLGSPMLFLARSQKFKKHLLLYAGIWCGLTFGAGLTIGGMVRPSAVTGALSAARCKKQGPLDKKLIGGALLFGTGWGLTGLCPGPLIIRLESLLT